MMWAWIARILSPHYQPLEQPQPLTSVHETAIDEPIRAIQKEADDLISQMHRRKLREARARQRIIEKQGNPRGIGRERFSE